MRNPDYSLVIYLTAAKLAQSILMDENTREKEEAKTETSNETFTQKLHLQRKRCKAFQKFQYSMNSILSSPTE